MKPADHVAADPVTSTEHVFIVGVSRSGTTLVRHILNRHSLIALCPENHFMGHLLPAHGVRHALRRFGDLRKDGNVRELAAFLSAGRLKTTSRWRNPSRLWVWLHRKVEPTELQRRLLAAERSERGVFDAIMELYAVRRGKRIKGEKTPAHLRYVDTLLAWYPSAKVIHMMRDPRAIFVSELRRRRVVPGSLPYRVARRLPPLLTAVVLLQVSLVWGEGAWRGRRYRRRFRDRYRVVRFEELVREPERSVRELCEFLDVEFELAMLEQSVVSEGARRGEQGFDELAADRWRRSIPKPANAWFRMLFASELRRLGYLELPSAGTAGGEQKGK